MAKLFQILLCSAFVLFINGCTEPPPPSGLHTTDGSYLSGPSSPEEAALVRNELDTQRAMRPAGHGMTPVNNPGAHDYNGANFNVNNYVKDDYYWHHHHGWYHHGWHHHRPHHP